jgi:hypothetical protein
MYLAIRGHRGILVQGFRVILAYQMWPVILVFRETQAQVFREIPEPQGLRAIQERKVILVPGYREIRERLGPRVILAIRAIQVHTGILDLGYKAIQVFKV